MIKSPQRQQQDANWKQAVVNDFLGGESVATISQRCCCHKLRVEQALREAIQGLSAIVVKAKAVAQQTVAPGAVVELT